jgi:hypothetical protein
MPSIQQRRSCQTRSLRRQRFAERPTPLAMDNFFITALVRAGTCSAHSTWTLASKPSSSSKDHHHKARRKPADRANTNRQIHSKRSKKELDKLDAEPQLPKPEISKEELRNLVDIYGEFKRQLGVPEPEVKLYDELEPMPGPEAVHAGIDDAFYFTHNDTRVELNHNIVTENLVHELKVLLNNRDNPPEKIFKVYRELPAPRVNFLPEKLLHRLLWHIGIVKRKDESVMLRYLSVIDDMKDAGRPISLRDWNTAIFLAGSCMGRITADDVESSLSIWRDMEKNAGVQGDHVTFSILFDLAVKSQQYALAEMIEKETRERGLQFDRISLMAKIYFHGIRGDGIGVRRAYSDLVEAGEIVDTFVLTNVISSLINAGELPAAEMTFDRMKRLHASKQGATLPPDDWYEERALQDILRDAAARYRTDTEGRLNFQEASPIAPNWRTYRAFIRHHTDHSGNYDEVVKLVEDMQQYGIRLNGPIYYCIFHGFLKHGGIRYSRWRLTLLDGFWERFLKGCEESPTEFFLGHGLALVLIKAFAKCAGKQRASEVWTDLRSRWNPPDKTLRAVNDVLDGLAQREGKSRWDN